MRRLRIVSALVLAAVVVGAALTACSSPPVEGSQEPQGLKGRVLFDMAHGEIFGPDDTSELGQSRAIQTMRDAGFDVQVNQEALTPQRLAGAAGLVLAGPMAPLQQEELAAVNEYVRKGGTLLLTIHVPFPVAALPAQLGLPVDPLIVRAGEAQYSGDPSVLLADRVSSDPVGDGVNGVFVVSGWRVRAESKEATIVVSTNATSTAGPVVPGQGGAQAEPGPCGMVGVARYGEGTVIVLGDDAIFANVAIDQAGNRQLLQNLVELFATSAKRV